MRREAKQVLDKLGLSLDVDTLCGGLTVAEQQLVEIAKGMTVDADIFIFDEPTAALSAHEIDKLEKLINAMRNDKKLIFYISHKLDEIFRFCDTVTILKDGQHVTTQSTETLNRDTLVSLMVGRTLGQLFPDRPTEKPTTNALVVEGLVTETKKSPISFTLKRGEILGLAGLEGQGQRDILRTLCAVQAPVSGKVSKLDLQTGNKQALKPTIVSTILAGVGFVPEDRKLEGLYLPLSIEQNIVLGNAPSIDPLVANTHGPRWRQKTHAVHEHSCDQ